MVAVQKVRIGGDPNQDPIPLFPVQGDPLEARSLMGHTPSIANTCSIGGATHNKHPQSMLAHVLTGFWTETLI